jgi:hypothetical protein
MLEAWSNMCATSFSDRSSTSAMCSVLPTLFSSEVTLTKVTAPIEAVVSRTPQKAAAILVEIFRS